MADIATFNGTTMIATLTVTGYVSVRDLYSSWLRWAHDNQCYNPFFDFAGGEIIDPTQGIYSPIYLKCVNGAKVKPKEQNQTLYITDGILMVDGGTGSPFLPVTGNYSIEIVRSSPIEAISFSPNSSGGGGSSVPFTVEDISNAVWQKAIGSLTAEQLQRYIGAVLLGTTSGIGTTTETFNFIGGGPGVVSHNDGTNRTGVSLV